jgi:CelD/BcsL family acetyltransferase involved in cellulose biosynthesis
MQRSPLVETHGDEGTYLKGLDGSFRRHLARRRRKLEREHATSWRVGADPQDLEAELTAVLELEAAGWKGRDRGAVLCSPAMTDFYRALSRAFHAAGRLRIDTIAVDGRLAAAQICLLDFDRLWMLRTAYDESLRSYGPGLLLSFAAVKWCFATGLEAFELLGDEQKWKRHLATAAHEHAVFRLYRARPLPLARFACRQVALPLVRRYAVGGGLRRSLTRSLVAGSDESRLRSH